MKYFVLLAILIVGCRPVQKPNENEVYNRIVDRAWRTSNVSRNGTDDPILTASEPVWNFRSDGKLYYSADNGAVRDTFDFVFDDSQVNISLFQQPGFINAYVIFVEGLSDTHLHFKLQTPGDTNFEQYRTLKD
jgi:hypothetical protein